MSERWHLLDRETLVRRNQQMAEALHTPSVNHHLRQRLIHLVAAMPFLPASPDKERFLFIKPDHLGDMLLATPAFRALKQAKPDAEIHVLAGAWSAAILENVPEVDLVLTVPFPGFDRTTDKKSAIAPYTQLIKTARQLRRIRYSTAFVMRPDHWWGAMLAYITGIRKRIGYNIPEVQPFLTQILTHQHEHVIRQHLRLIEKETGQINDEDVPYYLNVSESGQKFIQKYLSDLDNIHQPVVCIHPGSGTWVKQWTVEQWAQVADILVEQFEARVIFTGSGLERVLIDEIREHMTQQAYSSAGELNLDQLAALYQQAQIVIGCDSGPLHMAAAVQTPTLVLFGAADPVEFRTWGYPQRNHLILASDIGCRPCRILDWGDDDPAMHPCMRDITVKQVIDNARQIFYRHDDL